MSTTPFFSVIIPAHNEEKNIERLLNSLVEQSYQDFEIIVSNSDSIDNTSEVVEKFKTSFPTLRLLEEKTQNVSAARNGGAKHAVGQWLVFFDADVYVEKHFLKAMFKHIQVDRPSMATAWNRPSPASWRGRIIFGMMNRIVQLIQYSQPAANGPCILMRKSLFEKLGGFDQTIFFGEDYDIVKRAFKIGGIMRVYRNPLLFVSTRRFDKEGIIVSLYKTITALLYQIFIGPVRKPIFKYEMGGQYYEDKK